MSGTVEGAKKAAAANKAKHGEDYYRVIGKIGGQAPTDFPRGFAAMSPEKRSAAGKKGGAISRRTKKFDRMKEPLRSI